MFNHKALAWCVLAVALSCISLSLVDYRGIYTKQGIISALVLFGALIATQAWAESLRNYPTKYIPSGVYEIKYAESDGSMILLALWRDPEPKVSRRVPLKQVRLFCIPLAWLTPDNEASDGRLECRRISGHPVIVVRPAFLAQHPHATKELKAEVAA